MKLKKRILTTLGIAIILVLNSLKLYAIKARIVYNEVNVVISSIMKYTIPILIIVYIIFAIIYLKKSKKEKKIKIKTLCILLVIDIIAIIALYFLADVVLEAGKTYTSRPINWLK
jgi:Na+/H+-dicarboxylate symporter